ncbi:lysozyme inhibitor LprI family protein [Bosea sp. (in: a-proteobacteria)]|uniref:lysozyme inhibitor LprI family protein n=1 Tax=Bosea sp. (in: a-proteobacteria) TaxID=1871050 RepID=UPI002FCAF5AA
MRQLPLLIIAFLLPLAGPALAQAPGNSVQPGDRLQIASCMRQGAAASAACIGSVAVPCARAASGDRRDAEITCARREEAAWRERLVLATQMLGRTLDAGGRSQFTALQLAWEGYAVQKCAFYGSAQVPARAAGLQAGCELRETAQRALEIERFAAGRGRRAPSSPPQIIR